LQHLLNVYAQKEQALIAQIFRRIGKNPYPFIGIIEFLVSQNGTK
jgi:hypothetical protein